MTATMIPRAELDASAAFLRDGYVFGRRRFDRLRCDAFSTRLLGKPVIVTRGREAAEMFYDGDRFGRERAMPTSVVALLQDEGSVQWVTGAEHDNRKALFVRLLASDEALDRVSSIFIDEWLTAFRHASRVVLLSALVPVLTRTALRWVGIDPTTVDVAALGDSLSAMVVDAGRFGPANWATRLRRQRVERWARDYVAAERESGTEPTTDAAQLAHATDAAGNPLSPEIAAIELINVLRPTVAVGRFIVFAALALHRSPLWRERIAADPEQALPFVQEVRRYFPFFPVVGGRALRDFTWKGTDFATDDWVMLDLFATNHDARLWEQPDRFLPERFVSWAGDPYTLIPQGAGDVRTGHRCPGERATIRLMVDAVRLLASRTTFAVPNQRLDISLRTFPAAPQSGFVMTRVETR